MVLFFFFQVSDSLYFRWNHIQAILMMILMILARCCLKFPNDKTTGQMFQRIIVFTLYKERHNLIHWLLFLVRGNAFHYIISLSLLFSSLLPIESIFPILFSVASEATDEYNLGASVSVILYLGLVISALKCHHQFQF